jgi:hypothetical protein
MAQAVRPKLAASAIVWSLPREHNMGLISYLNGASSITSAFVETKKPMLLRKDNVSEQYPGQGVDLKL